MTTEEVVRIVEIGLKVLLTAFLPVLIEVARVEFEKWRAQQAEDSFYWQLESVVRKAVAAAEQLELSGELEEFAESKLEYALHYAETWLAGQGFPIDLDQFRDIIRGMIEAEVQYQFPKWEEGRGRFILGGEDYRASMTP